MSSGRAWKRTKEQKQRAEMALQQRYNEIEQRLVGKPVSPGWKKVVVTVPGWSPYTREKYEGPRED